MATDVKQRSQKQHDRKVTSTFDLLHFVSQQHCIFVLGCKGEERYELFRSYLSPSNRLQEIWNDIEENVTYVLYPSLDNEVFVNTEGEQLEKVHDITTDIQSASILFIPVNPMELPNGYVLVLPPPIFEDVPHVIENRILRNKKSEFIWVEAFPYGKSESFNALKKLEDELGILKHDVYPILVKSDRKFAFTDLDTLEEAIKLANELYVRQGYTNISSLVEEKMGSFVLLSIITQSKEYSEELFAQMSINVQKNSRYFKMFFEDDYLDLVSDLKLPIVLEKILNLKLVDEKIDNNIFKNWVISLESFLKEQVHGQIQNLLVNNYDMNKVYPSDQYQILLNELFQENLKTFMKKIKKYENRLNIIPTNIDQSKYMVSITKSKMHLKQQVVDYIEKDMFDSLNNHIEHIYEFWIRD